MDIDELLRYTVERGASDLHLKAGNVPFVRVDGELSPAELGYLSAADTDRFADALMSEHKKREFEQTNEADLGYTLSGVGRFRVNVFRQRGVIGLAIRRVRAEVPSFEELRLPPVMSTLAASPRGLILIDWADGHREDDDHRGDDRPHQPHAPDPHRDRGRSYRGRPRRPALDHPAARDRDRHGLVRGRPPARHPAGPRRDLHRGDP